MIQFLVVVIQMAYAYNTLRNNCGTTEQIFTPFYGIKVRHDRFLHILTFLHFSNNGNALSNNDLNYDRPRKLRHILDFLNDEY
jgi:hypothetical protein